jgi:hypothetical protein
MVCLTKHYRVSEILGEIGSSEFMKGLEVGHLLEVTNLAGPYETIRIKDIDTGRIIFTVDKDEVLGKLGYTEESGIN